MRYYCPGREEWLLLLSTSHWVGHYSFQSAFTFLLKRTFVPIYIVSPCKLSVRWQHRSQEKKALLRVRNCVIHCFQLISSNSVSFFNQIVVPYLWPICIINYNAKNEYQNLFTFYVLVDYILPFLLVINGCPFWRVKTDYVVSFNIYNWSIWVIEAIRKTNSILRVVF